MSLYTNISERFSNLESKCTVQVKKLTDSQVMEMNSDLKLVDSDFNDLLDRITQLGQLNPAQFSETVEFLPDLTVRKNQLKGSIEIYKTTLRDEITERDLSVEKLKNAASVGIKLPVFKGYESTLDYYTFKAEFEKLIVPRYSKPLLPEYLKNNYLRGQALELVKETHDLDQIWERLERSFGNVSVLLSTKLNEVDKIAPLQKINNDGKLVESITKLRNSMSELKTLAGKHKIEGSLYHSSNLSKIFELIGDKRQKDITRKLLDQNKTSCEDKWDAILTYLEKEARVCMDVALFKKAAPSKEKKPPNTGGNSNESHTAEGPARDKKKCIVCQKTDHVPTTTRRGNKIINYFSCEKFVSMSVSERFEELKRKGMCFQCLTPGMKANHTGFCFDKYKCPHESHANFQRGIHVMICDKHKTDNENVELFEAYKLKYITNATTPLPDYSQNIALHTELTEAYRVGEGEEAEDMAIYMLQTVKLFGRHVNIFYDSGCRDMVCRKETVDWLKGKGKAKQVVKGPLTLHGVNEQKSICWDGRYQIILSLANGEDAKVSGICLKKITGTFPRFPLTGAEIDLRQAFQASGGDPTSLPKLPKFVGGDTDIMLGVQYLKWFPKEIFSLPNGLKLYESQFANIDGSRGVVCGPHSSFLGVYRGLGENHMAMSAYICHAVNNYRNGYSLGLDIPLLGMKESKGDHCKYDNDEFGEESFSVLDTYLEEREQADELIKHDFVPDICPEVSYLTDELTEVEHSDVFWKIFPKRISNSPPLGTVIEETESNDERIPSDDMDQTEGPSLCVGCGHVHESEVSGETRDAYVTRRPPKLLRSHEKLDEAGTKVDYRCIRCRECKNCLAGGKIEFISIQEEVEQGIIDQSVDVNLTEGHVTAKLPFLCDPTKKLVSNEPIAKKIYFAQVKKLNIDPKDKDDVVVAEQKLQDLGFVDYLDNLNPEQRKKIFGKALKYFIPWRAVWNANSLSTPCRPVFDASHPTTSGLSLNNILAKGRNNMNKLVQIFIRWLIRGCGFHADIQKMYNTVRLHEDHWNYQLYLWDKNLDPKVEPKVKVIKTLIYGVKPSGNQVERALRETANLQKEEFPRPAEIVNDDFYVDDNISGEVNYEVAKDVTDDLSTVIGKTGFNFKGITFSGFDPPEHLSNPDKSVNVGGLKWFSKEDLLGLNISDLNFGKVVRGRKSPKLSGVIPDTFTRANCASRVAEVWDALGKVTPITVGFKLDLSELCKRKLDWDDPIPDDLVPIWKLNFDTISKLGDLKFRRAIVPDDALNLDMETLEMADASHDMACAATYARFKRRDGSYSCQLVFSRSKIVPSGTSIPRAELFAAVLNATTGHIVYSSLKDFITKRIHLTDSIVTLCWINNVQSELNLFVRNRSIEVNRLTDIARWFHIGTKNMLVDIATRRGAGLSDVGDGSVFNNGQDWDKLEEETFPITSIRQIKLSKNDLDLYKGELVKSEIHDKDWINEQLTHMYCYSSTVYTSNLNEIGQRYQFSNYIIEPNKFRFRKVVRINALVLLFVQKLLSKRQKSLTVLKITGKQVPNQFQFNGDKYLVTEGSNKFPFVCRRGLTVQLTEELLLLSLVYYFRKATLEIKEFMPKNSCKKFSKEENGILYHTGRILPTQKISNKLNLADVCLDLDMGTFCVPLIEKHSPLAFALINEIHWYSDDARHCGNETVMRYVENVAHIIEGKGLVKQFRKECARCRFLNKKAVDIAMGPVSDDNLKIAPPFYVSQVDMFGPFKSYSNINKRATTKIWFVVFCCCVTGAIDVKLCEDYSANSFILAFIRFSCKVGYPRRLLPDPGSQLVKGCDSMTICFTDISNVLHEYGVTYELCPVGAHFMHGKVERKIRHIKESLEKHVRKERLSTIQWETLGDQVANRINNLPIALGNYSQGLEDIDLLTPNRLLLARNNDRCPVGTLKVTGDLTEMVESNNKLVEAWFKSWLTSYVPSLMHHPKWFNSERDPKIGDVVLFLKSEREFDKQYQYGIICDVKKSRDGKIRQVDIEYQNHTEKTKRVTNRGTRDIVVIHPVGEIGIIRELNILSGNLSH